VSDIDQIVQDGEIHKFPWSATQTRRDTQCFSKFRALDQPRLIPGMHLMGMNQKTVQVQQTADLTSYFCLGSFARQAGSEKIPVKIVR